MLFLSSLNWPPMIAREIDSSLWAHAYVTPKLQREIIFQWNPIFFLYSNENRHRKTIWILSLWWTQRMLSVPLFLILEMVIFHLIRVTQFSYFLSADTFDTNLDMAFSDLLLQTEFICGHLIWHLTDNIYIVLAQSMLVFLNYTKYYRKFGGQAEAEKHL